MRLAGPLLAVVLLPCLLRAAPTLEQLAGNPALWPQEVTLTSAAKAAVIRNGQPAGVMLVGAGKKITVTRIAADGVTGKLGGETVRVPVEKTDLLSESVSARPGAAPAGAGGEKSSVAPAGGSTPSVRESAAEKKEILSTVLTTGAPAEPTAMQRKLSAKLVRLQGGKLTGINTDAELAGVKYYAFYYSASWCGPCRQFTPQLVRAYRELKQKHPEFELVFMSNDNSAGDMAGYMKSDAMPWPAMKYELATRSELNRYAGPGIPCLVLVDANGKVLADSFQGDNYLGPGHVLTETWRILERGI